jgi:hypothetical protein
MLERVDWSLHAIEVMEFLEQDLKTPLPCRLHFKSSDKVVERGGGITDQESRLMLDKAIAKGRGGIFLELTVDQ